MSEIYHSRLRKNRWRRFSPKLVFNLIHSLCCAIVSRVSLADSALRKLATMPKPKKRSQHSMAKIFWAAHWWSTKLARNVKAAALAAEAGAVVTAAVMAGEAVVAAEDMEVAEGA